VSRFSLTRGAIDHPLLKLGVPAIVTALMVREFVQARQRLDVGLNFLGVEHEWPDIEGPAGKMSAYLRAFVLWHRIHGLLETISQRIDRYCFGVFIHSRL
jgi:hypothetical protein